jgi:hypothetical protein
VAVRAQLGRAAVGVHGAHRALHRAELAAGVARHDPVLAQLHVHHVAVFQVDDLVGDAGQGHGVRRQEVGTAAAAPPRPRISGEPSRAPTTRCGSSRQNTAMA